MLDTAIEDSWARWGMQVLRRIRIILEIINYEKGLAVQLMC